MPTADWNNSPPMTKSMTGHKGYGGYWACRKVRKNGTIQLGETYRPAPDTQTLPEPGEWLLFFKYSYDSPHLGINEWTAPVDPDGYIRRMFWKAI